MQQQQKMVAIDRLHLFKIIIKNEANSESPKPNILKTPDSDHIKAFMNMAIGLVLIKLKIIS